MGIFSGSLRFTSYRGSNLLRMEAIAKTDEQSVAYKYEGGLKGFSTALTPRVTWRDRGGDPQQYEFGGLKNDSRVTVKAKNRVLVAGGGKNGSIATFTPPHVVLLHARSRHQPRIHLVPQRRRHAVRHGHPPGRRRRSAAVHRELRAAQRASRHDAAHGGVLPDHAGHGRSHAAGGDGVHARRRLQAGSRLQDDGEPLPSAVHRAAARVRIARQHVRRSDGDALGRHQHRRPERLPRRSASERSGRSAGTRISAITTWRRRKRPTRTSS